VITAVTTSWTDDAILDDLFHGCALAAFVEQASVTRGWPDIEHVRRHAFALYERSLSERAALRHGERCHETVTLAGTKVR
jgi:hypothetical protein